MICVFIDMRHPVLSHFLYVNMIKSVCSVSKFPLLIIPISVITKLFKVPSHHVTAQKIHGFLRAWKAFPEQQWFLDKLNVRWKLVYI